MAGRRIRDVGVGDMADPEALEMLRAGAKEWNAWRTNGAKTVDLRNASLIGFDFRRFDLKGVDFSNSDLRTASFVDNHLFNVQFDHNTANEARFVRVSIDETLFADCNLSSSYFTEVQCRLTSFARCDLERADLSLSMFTATQFDHVNLKRSYLNDTSFHKCSLTDVIFARALLADTVFANCTLVRPNGLERSNHASRSSIDLHTLLATPLPEAFLRGVGLPEIVITYLDSLKNNPIEYYSCFLSYSSNDDDFARRLYNDLQARGIRTWFAPEDLKIGDRFQVRIDESIRVHDKLVLVLSANSVASDWVEMEVEAALERERRDKRSVLFPIAIDEAGFTSGEPWAADIRRKRHIGDFRKWKSHDDYAAAFERLVRDLKKG